MRDDLRNFFNEDAYNELLNVYAEEDAKKAQHKTAVSKEPSKPLPSDTRRLPTKQELHAAEHMRKTSSAETSAHRSAVQHTPNVQRTHPASDRFAEPLTPAAPPKNFKLEIKDLDAEFQTEAELRAQRAANAENARRQRAAQSTQQGAFENFSEVIKKRRPVQHAEPQELVTEEFPQAGEAVAKKFTEKLDWNTVRAFLLKNKKAWIIVLICIAASVLLSSYTISCMNDVFAIRRDSETVVTVNIPAGAHQRCFENLTG